MGLGHGHQWVVGDRDKSQRAGGLGLGHASSQQKGNHFPGKWKSQGNKPLVLSCLLVLMLRISSWGSMRAQREF